MFKNIALALALILILPFIAGCFEIEERVSIAPDGVSDLDFRMRLTIPQDEKKKGRNPVEDVKAKLSGVGSGVEGVAVENFEVKNQYGMAILMLDLKADSFSDLRNSYDTFPKEEKAKSGKPEPGDAIEKVFSKKGFYTIKKKGKKLVIERKIGTKKKKAKAKGKDKDIEMLMSMLGGIMLRFDLVVPSKVISTNAESVHGNTLSWVVPLQYLDGNTVTLRAEIESTPELAKAILVK